MNRMILIYISMIATLFVSSCAKDLNLTPIDPNVAIASNVFKTVNDYKMALAKIYASYAISGQNGGGGQPDIQGIEEFFGNYLRQYFDLQELSTDEAIMAWDDQTIKNFHAQTWAANDVFIAALYSRIFYTITLANEFIRNTAGSANDTIKSFSADARFLRAFSYWHAIDLFGNVSFVTEADKPGVFNPTRIKRADLFTYIESELKALESELPATKAEYGRPDAVSAWFLLAELYLNAGVYTGTPRYTDALTYINKVIGSPLYSLDPNYLRIFSADNNKSPEIIFPINFDGQNTQQSGGMTFIMSASKGGGMPNNGLPNAWGGIRTIKTFAEGVFGLSQSNFTATNPEDTLVADKRARFYFNPATWNWGIPAIANIATFTYGIGITKYHNTQSNGSNDPNHSDSYASTDFPVFRLSEAYLIYAELVLRGGTGGDLATALTYVNTLRQRAYGNTSGNIIANQLTLNFILDERGRELYWECKRRTDLVRFGKFTGAAYLWEWKGNVEAGVSTDAYRDLYPIPTTDLTTNPNLIQNTGY